MIDGRDERGAPYWTFIAQQRYFEGYSVSGVPPEFAKHAGCAPDAATGLSIANLSGCRDLSLHWRLASPTGASIGYLAAPLQRLGVRVGETVRVTILRPGVVELSAEPPVEREPNEQPSLWPSA